MLANDGRSRWREELDAGRKLTKAEARQDGDIREDGRLWLDGRWVTEENYDLLTGKTDKVIPGPGFDPSDLGDV